MAKDNIFKLIADRIKVDYYDWMTQFKGEWYSRKEARLVKAAKRRAEIKNRADGRTYYIVVDIRGGVNALNSSEIKKFQKMGLFPKWNAYQLLSNSRAIVTSNKQIFEQYRQIQLKNEDFQHEK